MPDFSKIWATNSPLPEYTFSDADYLTGWDFVAAAPPTKSQFDAWFKQTDEKLQYLYEQLQNTTSKLYPIGSVYISFNSTDPSTLFGGTWQRLKDTFLLVNGNSYAPNTTGGSATKTIAVSNLPSHTHAISWDGGHTHTRGTMNIAGAFNATSQGEVVGASGAFSGRNVGYGDDGQVPNELKEYSFDASRNWWGETSWNGNHTHTIGNTGSSLPLNIMPPYTTVYAWRRTA